MDRRSGRNALHSDLMVCPSSHESKQEEEYGYVQNQHNGKSSVECLAINDTGICVVCFKTSVCKCERCDDFYCSPKCQSQDWPKHRYICFPMPRLVKINQSTSHINEALPPMLKANVNAINEMSKDDKRHSYKARQSSYNPSSAHLPEDGSDVIVTGFRSTNRCSIRSADKAVTEEYFKVLMKIDDFGKNSGEMQSFPKVNSFALAQINEQWARVQIIATRTKDRVGVFFTDYGVVSFKFLHELRKIHGSICSLPCYVNTAQLNDITIFSLDANVLDQLSHLTNKKFKMQIVDSDEKGGNIKLFHIDTNSLVNSEILEICGKYGLPRNPPASNSSHISYENDVDNEVVVKKAKEIVPLGRNETKNQNTEKTAESGLNRNEPGRNSSRMSYDDDDAEVVVKKSIEILPLERNGTKNQNSVKKTESRSNRNGPGSNSSHTSCDNDATDDVEFKKSKDILPLRSNEKNNQNNEKQPEKCPIDSTTTPTNSRGSNIDTDHCMMPPFETIEFEHKLKNFKIIVVDSSFIGQGLVACILESDCKTFMAVQMYFANWKDTKQHYKPKLNEYCIAQFETEWYRAKVVEVLGNDRFIVNYIDFANECKVSSESIRQYPMDLTLPCCTNLCAIDGLPAEICSELISYIEKFFSTNKTLIVDDIKIEDNYMFLNCKDLLKELRLKKLIK